MREQKEIMLSDFIKRLKSYKADRGDQPVIFMVDIGAMHNRQEASLVGIREDYACGNSCKIRLDLDWGS